MNFKWSFEETLTLTLTIIECISEVEENLYQSFEYHKNFTKPYQ